ncbi:MAG: uroporphyrinogen-III synthase, partial [Immundisolibacteraceae bacterium]|nr:uroporphyrinogen-III synthase [Immundisolibacteraceae bacterium]
HLPLPLPTLAIAPADAATIAVFKGQLANPALPDWLIFISANAVEQSWIHLDSTPNLVKQARIAAVGSATAAALTDRGITVDAIPREQFDSDGLLALAPFQSPLNQKILIIRGQGGRPYLGEQLAFRGAQVEYGECYQRLLPSTGTEQLTAWLLSNNIDLITITSRATLRNLFKLCALEHHHLLKRLSYALLSPAIESEAHKLGINGQIVIADQATDQGLCNLLDSVMDAN